MEAHLGSDVGWLAGEEVTSLLQGRQRRMPSQLHILVGRFRNLSADLYCRIRTRQDIQRGLDAGKLPALLSDRFGEVLQWISPGPAFNEFAQLGYRPVGFEVSASRFQRHLFCAGDDVR